MVRENVDAQDGADEKMLSTDDKETLALKDVEVKFIAADPNGDAKIEIESTEKVSCKSELIYGQFINHWMNSNSFSNFQMQTL